MAALVLLVELYLLVQAGLAAQGLGTKEMVVLVAVLVAMQGQADVQVHQETALAARVVEAVEAAAHRGVQVPALVVAVVAV